MRKIILGFATAATMSIMTATAGAATVDFAGFSNGDLVTGFDFGNGLTGTLAVINGETNAAGEGRIFDTRRSTTLDPDLENPFTNSLSPFDVRPFGNALIVQAVGNDNQGTPDDEASGGIFTFTFDRAIDLFSLLYLDGEEGASIQVGGNTVAGFERGISGDNRFVELFLNGQANGITQFSVFANGSGAIGGFEASVSQVPLPAALPLMAAGMGLLGFMGWRRKNAA